MIEYANQLIGGYMKFNDLTGQKFNSLTVKERLKRNPKRTEWVCECDCGATVIADSGNLKTGKHKSCRECANMRSSIANTTHGMRDTRLYRIWCHMRERCAKEYSDQYQWYGARGITVCDDWNTSFEPFRDWAFTNGYSDDLTIDRIDNDGNYEPSNCKWVSMKEQSRNRRTTVLTKSLLQKIDLLSPSWGGTEIASLLGVPRSSVYNYLSGTTWND